MLTHLNARGQECNFYWLKNLKNLDSSVRPLDGPCGRRDIAITLVWWWNYHMNLDWWWAQQHDREHNSQTQNLPPSWYQVHLSSERRKAFLTIPKPCPKPSSGTLMCRDSRMMSWRIIKNTSTRLWLGEFHDRRCCCRCLTRVSKFELSWALWYYEKSLRAQASISECLISIGWIECWCMQTLVDRALWCFDL